MDFFLFIVLNAVLFVRPADLVPGLEGVNFYESVILLCLAVSAPKIARKLTLDQLVRQPITAGLLAVLVAVVLSHLAYGRAGLAFESGFRFFKVILYYLLMIAVVDSPAKLRRFTGWITVLILGITGLALLRYHGAIDLATLDPVGDRYRPDDSGEAEMVTRLRGTGIFNDPNDLCVVLIVGLMISLGRLREGGKFRAMWLVPVGLLAYAFPLTYSRTGIVALFAALAALLVSQFGARRALIVGGPLMVAVVAVLGGRQVSVDINSKDDTSQHRVRLWRDGIVLLREEPVFGIGAGRYAEEVGLPAHNSFVDAFTELGLGGGAVFAGLFLYPIWVLYRLGATSPGVRDPVLRDLRPPILASAAGLAAGMMSLTRMYTLTSYTVLGMVSVYLALAAPRAGAVVPRLSVPLMARILALSGVLLGAIIVFVRTFAGTG